MCRRGPLGRRWRRELMALMRLRRRMVAMLVGGIRWGGGGLRMRARSLLPRPVLCPDRPRGRPHRHHRRRHRRRLPSRASQILCCPLPIVDTPPIALLLGSD